MKRFVCIHGHFYQPPRENPWLEAVERQDSARPYHDWNERITAECYAPNAVSRILDGDGHITALVNNYAQISFNAGPTLLTWLARHAPETYQALLDADRAGRERFSGHGPALAQPYGHIIMPLATERDRQTHIRWGIADFRARFGREPEGMWLPETAVDYPTLQALAAHGLRFALLAPHQAAQVRPPGGEWQEIPGGRIDTRRAYRCPLPDGKEITLFFYDGNVAREVAFGGLLHNGEAFARRLTELLHRGPEPQLAHIAVDGETFGHHHRHGEMALSYALHQLNAAEHVATTVYGEFLERFPPDHEVRIVERTAWSCAHGVERWRGDCGCQAGGRTGWHQRWRAPLRASLDWLRDALDRVYSEQAAALLRDPWAARDAYSVVLLDRTPAAVDAWLQAQAGRTLTPAEQVRALRLLEMQRHALLMFTSCGWFFADISGPETVQILRYAARAIQLAEQAAGIHFTPAFLAMLEQASGNMPEYGNGAEVYRQLVQPAVVDTLRFGAHYALTSLFTDYAEQQDLHSYATVREDYLRVESGNRRFAVGRVRLESRLTREAETVSFAVMHLGDHNLSGGVRLYQGQELYAEMRAAIEEPFRASDIPEIVRLIDRHFGGHAFTLWHLFRDEQDRIVHELLARVAAQTEQALRPLAGSTEPLLQFLHDARRPYPPVFGALLQFLLERDLERLVELPPQATVELHRLREAAARRGLTLDFSLLAYRLEQEIAVQCAALSGGTPSPDVLHRFVALLELARAVPADINYWRAENLHFLLLRDLPERLQASSAADGTDWQAAMDLLGGQLPRAAR